MKLSPRSIQAEIATLNIAVLGPFDRPAAVIRYDGAAGVHANVCAIGRWFSRITVFVSGGPRCALVPVLETMSRPGRSAPRIYRKNKFRVSLKFLTPPSGVKTLCEYRMVGRDVRTQFYSKW